MLTESCTQICLLPDLVGYLNNDTTTESSTKGWGPMQAKSRGLAWRDQQPCGEPEPLKACTEPSNNNSKRARLTSLVINHGDIKSRHLVTYSQCFWTGLTFQSVDCTLPSSSTQLEAWAEQKHWGNLHLPAFMLEPQDHNAHCPANLNKCMSQLFIICLQMCI
jgi:hypothetical protein